MADPKYVNLPGIDTSSPDLYETNDLPESDQDQVTGDDSETVENLNVSPSEAFSKFKGKSLGGENIDFSDKVSYSRRTGYDVPQTEYEIVGDKREKETPQQKYQRLQHEIRELTEEVTQVKDNVKADAASEKLSAVPLTKQVEYLHKQLADLHLDKLLGQHSEFNLADPQGALQKRLLTELDAYKPVSEEGEKKPAAGGTDAGADGDHVTYQLYYRPEQAKFTNNARMADIEQRMERLEAVIGNNPERLSSLTADTSNKSLVGAIAVLSAKTKLLDPTQLDQVEGRLHALGIKLTQITDKKEAIEQADKQNKVSELYDMVKKWDAVVDTLPHVVDRLSALKDLHEQALQFSQALAHLDTAQQQINGHLSAHHDMLRQVESKLSENMASIKANVDSIDSRVKVLK